MRWIVLVTLAACSTDHAVNAVIGDVSFVRTFGRLPTAADDPDVRVATHLAYVERQLRARPGNVLRERSLAALDRYRVAGVYPHGEVAHGPVFVDARSRARCAVAYLVEQSAGAALMTAIDRDHHAEHIADIGRDPRFVMWAATTGLDLDELALIQPEYEPKRDENIEVDVAAAYGYASAAHRTLVAAETRWLPLDDSSWPTSPWLGVRGAFGWGARDVAYAAHALVGFTFTATWFSQTREHISFDAGVGADRTGDLALRAITVPFDLTWRRALIQRERDLRAGLQIGIHGGPRFALTTDRETGWAAGVDLTRSSPELDYLVARDVRISLDAEQLAGAMFVGVSLGFAFRSEHEDLQ